MTNLWLFDLQPKQSFPDTKNQSSSNIPDLCACLNTNIGMVLSIFIGVLYWGMGEMGGPGQAFHDFFIFYYYLLYILSSKEPKEPLGQRFIAIIIGKFKWSNIYSTLSYSTIHVLAAAHSPILNNHWYPSPSALSNPTPPPMSYQQRTHQSYTTTDAFVHLFQ